MDRFYGYLHGLLDEFVPTTVPKRTRSHLWMSAALARLRNRKRAAGRRARIRGIQQHDCLYTELSDAFSAQNAREYVEYVQREGLKLKTDPKRFWSFVDSKRTSRDLPTEMTLGSRAARGDKEIGDLLALITSQTLSPLDPASRRMPWILKFQATLAVLLLLINLFPWTR